MHSFFLVNAFYPKYTAIIVIKPGEHAWDFFFRSLTTGFSVVIGDIFQMEKNGPEVRSKSQASTCIH
jgi:hypothetical protein